MTMDPLLGDPLIINGDLFISGGQPTMSSGLENAAYLSLIPEPDWWGNLVKPDEELDIGSRHFIALTKTAKLMTSILGDVEEAISADLAWMTEQGVAKSVTPSASIQSPGWVAVEIAILEPDDSTTTVRWALNWDYMKELAG